MFDCWVLKHGVPESEQFCIASLTMDTFLIPTHPDLFPLSRRYKFMTVYLFVCLSARLQQYYWLEFHEKIRR